MSFRISTQKWSGKPSHLPLTIFRYCQKWEQANSIWKPHFVVQAYNDKFQGLLTHTLTVQRSSFRLLLILLDVDNELQLFLCNVSQAYVQSYTPIQRPVLFVVPSILALPLNLILRIECSFYGLPEAGMHWFRTYHQHHRNSLGFTPAAHDLCLLYTQKVVSRNYIKAEVARGFTCLQMV